MKLIPPNDTIILAFYELRKCRRLGIFKFVSSPVEHQYTVVMRGISVSSLSSSVPAFSPHAATVPLLVDADEVRSPLLRLSPFPHHASRSPPPNKQKKTTQISNIKRWSWKIISERGGNMKCRSTPTIEPFNSSNICGRFPESMREGM